MLISNFPTFSYATWQGLIIISADKTPYVVNDGNTDCKYVYWEIANPYTLKATNDKLSTSPSRFLIYINDGGIASEVPQDVIGIQYREGSGVLISKISGQVNELDGKYYAIKEDLEGLEKIIGSSDESETGSIVDRVNKIEQTAEETKETIDQLETTYNRDKESERLRDGISEALIAMATALGEYQEVVSSACEDFKISSEEKSDIQNAQNNFIRNANLAFEYHETLVSRILTDENVEQINLLNYAKSNLQMAVNNLNNNVNTSISDNTVVPTEITTMLNMFSNIGVRANEYKEILSEAIVLGIGGEIVENIFSSSKTATEFNQRIANITEVIDGETGLKVQVKANETNIQQTAEEIKLNYMKYDTVTSEITVADNLIKLNAGTVLMTGTLTWDSLDDNAKANLKGDKGENGTAEYVMLTGDQFIKYDAQGNANKSSVLITALISGITDIPSIVWKYKAENSGEWKTITANANKTYYSLPSNSSLWDGKDSITIRAIVNNTYYDDLTVAKVRDGVDGTLAEYVEINGDNVFKYTINKGTTEFTPKPTVITLEGVAHNISTTNTKWYYRRPGEDTWVLMGDYNNSFSMIVSPDDTTLFPNENDVVQIKFELNTHYDIITLTKLYDGRDSVMAILSNESHIIPCKSDGTPTTYEGATTNLSIYVGNINDTQNWTISGTTDGVTGNFTNNNRTFTVTNILGDIGYVDFIALKNDFDSVTKRFTISKAKNGLDGFLGKDSISYWIIPSASAIIKKEDGSFYPSEIEFNAKKKEGEKEVCDHECIFKIYEKVSRVIGEIEKPEIEEPPVAETETIEEEIEETEGTEEEGGAGRIEEEWVLKYTSSSKESKCIYSITSPNEIKVCLCNDDGEIVIDEEHIPMLADGEATPVAFLDNDSHIIPCNFNGIPLNYEGAETTIHVYMGSTDDSDNWTYEFIENDVEGIIMGSRTYMVTSINNDTAYVDIVARKEGFDDIIRRFTITKAINGQNGESAKYVVISGEQVFKYSDNFEGEPTPRTITLTATKYNINSVGKWQYKNGKNYVDLSQYQGDTIEISPSMGTFDTQNVSTFRYIAEDYYDEITIIKISDGTNGLPGSDGEDSIYILLTNENHSIPCDSEGNYKQEDLEKAITEIHVYKGLDEVNFRISEIKCSEGCQAETDVSNNIPIVRLTNLNVNSGTITISIVVENKTFTKVMSVSKALQGGAGSGINVLGTLATIDDLPDNGSINDAYLIDGMMYIWSASENDWVEGTTVGAIKGEKGEDGRTTYFHIKYSNDGGKTFTENNGETIGDWIGFYTDFYEDDSTVVTAYQWKKIKGEQGENGIVVNLTNDSHTIPCKADGITINNSFNGCETEISLFLGAEELNDGVTYEYELSDEGIGVAWEKSNGYIKVTAMNNIDNGYIDLFAIYNGVRYGKRFTIAKSKQGEDSITVNLSNENHSFLANSEGIIENPQSVTIQITAFKGIDDEGYPRPVEFTIGGLPNINGLSLAKRGTTEIIISTTNDGTVLAENGVIDIPIGIDGISVTKQFTYTKVSSGKDGTDGLDAYTVYLTNETHSFYCESNGTILEKQSTVTTVKAFFGTKEVTPTIGSISDVEGLLITKNGASVMIETDGRSLASSGSFNIPITIDGKSFVKVFSWTKSFKGQDGQNGESAKYVVVSGEQVFRYTKGSAIPTPSNILLSASRFNMSSKGRWQYKNNSGEYIDLGVETDVLTVTPSTGTLVDTGSCTFRYIVDDIYDEITIVEVSDGVDGNSGQSLYTWIMYANDENGLNMSNNPTGKKYIGLSYNNTTSVESTDPSKYQWTLIKGEDGVEGAKGEDGITYYTWIKYSNYEDGSSMYDTPNSNTEYIGIGVNKPSQTESTNKSDYRWTKFRGDDGVDGKDSYTIILTNENHSFVSESNGNITSAISITCQVIAYKGINQIAPTIGSITNPSGLTITKSGTTLTITALTGTSLAESGSVTIPITVDGITFRRVFSWTKVRKGEKGDKGDAGTDANVPNWVKEWDSGKTTINNTTVLAPKIFAGSVNGGKPTGVAMGTNVFGTTGTYSNISGIAGYKNGEKMYHFSTDGSVLLGKEDGKYISWDGSNLKMNVNSLQISSNDVATVNAVDTKLQNYPTIETVDSKISASANSINTEVSKTYATKGDVQTLNDVVLANYTQKSEMEQTAEYIKLSFTRSGGNNKIKNSAYKDGENNWCHLSWNSIAWISGATTGMTVLEPYNNQWCLANRNVLQAYCHGLHTNTWEQLGVGFDCAQRFWGGTDWTFSCLLASHRTQEVYIEILEYDNNNNRLSEQNTLMVTNDDTWSGGRNSEDWKKINWTFSLKNNGCAYFIIRVFMGRWNGQENSAYLWMAEPMLVLGHWRELQYTPNSDELYAGVVKIDGEGLHVSNSNAGTTTTMNANGFYINQSGHGDIFKVDGGGISLQQGLVSLNMNGLTVNSPNSNTQTYLDANGLNIIQNGQSALMVHTSGLVIQQGLVSLNRDGLAISHPNGGVNSYFNAAGVYFQKDGRNVVSVDGNGLNIGMGVTTVNSAGVTVTHNDGSYTQLNASGLMHYQGGSGRRYHYLTYAGEYTCESEQYVTIYLPEEFRGKNFQVITSIKRIYVNLHEHVTNARFPLLSFYAGLEWRDIWNCCFQVYASVRAWNRTGYGGYGSLIGDGNASEKQIMKPVVAYWVFA